MKIKNNKALIFVLLIIFVLIQLIHPIKNNYGVDANHIIKREELPVKVENIFTVSCFDCHSNQTNYKWYDNIAPASWVVKNHILDGKSEVNFSNWGLLDDFDKIADLNNISSEVREKKMPLRSYTFIHRKAKLNKEKIQLLSQWCEMTSVKLLNTSDSTNEQ